MRFSRFVLAATVLAPLAAQAQVAPPAAPAPAAARLAATTGPASDPARDAAIEKLTAFLSKYPNSPLRPNALYQLGELLVRRADEDFAAAQRNAGAKASSGTPEKPDYAPAIARLEELVRRYPDFDRIDGAAYTLGTLYFSVQRNADAARMFEVVTSKDSSTFRPEAYFRLGDAEFEMAAALRGDARRAMFAKAATAYEKATTSAPKGGDIYFLSLYKLGWSYYNQATKNTQAEYTRAVDVFGRLIAEYDKLSPEAQSRLGLRGEALEYMAVAFTQVGGAQAAQQYFASNQGSEFRLPVLKRVAESLREQGEFPRAIEAYRAVIAQAPTDSSALGLQRAIVETFRDRIIAPDSAQAARLKLVEDFGPGSAWATANPSLVPQAQTWREEALRQAGQYALAHAQQTKDRAAYASAAQLYGRYVTEFASSDSAQAVNRLYGEALFGQGEFMKAGAEYSRAAYAYKTDAKLAQEAGQNAVVAFDSALMHNKTDATTQDSLFAAVDRFVAAFPQSDVAKKALIQKGRRASEVNRWDVMATTFETYAKNYPNDAYTPQAQKLIGDALFKQGRYPEAQAQWDVAASLATSSGKRALADTISRLRTAAARGYADTLKKTGDYKRAAEEVYVAYADKNPNSAEAPKALADAIVAYLAADSIARERKDDGASRQARERAIELTSRLVKQYPSYKDRLQYQLLEARLLGDLGRRDESITALQALIRDNPGWSGRPDAMIRVAVTFDSAGRKKDAAEAYEQFAQAYPKDKRAADAQYNAAVTYAESGDTTTAIRAYSTFASRFPGDARASQAREQRVVLYKAKGDTARAMAELRSLCLRPTAENKATCAASVGESEFRQGAALFPQYQAARLVIATTKQLTKAGVDRASAKKKQLLQQMDAHFTRAIASGSSEWLSAATYYVGLGQWEYGNFLANAQLPSGLSPEAKDAAQKGASQQAEAYYNAARKSWQSLIDKATSDKISNVWVDRTQEALQGKVPATPPTNRRDAGAVTRVGGFE